MKLNHCYLDKQYEPRLYFENFKVPLTVVSLPLEVIVSKRQRNESEETQTRCSREGVGDR